MAKLSYIPPSHRRVDGMCVGFFFGDITPMKLPGDEWLDTKATAKFVASQSPRYIAFKRYVYDPEDGRVEIDPGWVFFGGRRIRKDDILSGKAERKIGDFRPTEVLKSNVKSNGFDIIWFGESQKAYPMHKYDVFIGI